MCNDYSLKFVPKTSRLYKYSQCLNMASRKLLMSRSLFKEVNYLKNWKTKHRFWGNLFKCVCKQGLQDRKDRAIFQTLSVRRYVTLQFLHESAKNSKFALVIDVNCASSCAVGSREMVSPYYSSSASIAVALKTSLLKTFNPR